MFPENWNWKPEINYRCYARYICVIWQNSALTRAISVLTSVTILQSPICWQHTVPNKHGR